MSVVVFAWEGQVMTDVHAMVKALQQERELVDQAIVTLEILARARAGAGARPYGHRGILPGPESVGWVGRRAPGVGTPG